MVQEVLISISLIILIAAVLTVIARFIRQPPIIAYLFTGILVGPIVLNLIGPGADFDVVQTFARIGVAFLLFIVGLSLDFRLLKEIGKVSTIVGVIQVLVVGIFGYFLAFLLGFTVLASIYIAIALAFSSTVVVIKILSDKKQIDTLHGRIAIGILIVQDILAALALMILPVADNFIQNSREILIKFGLAFIIVIIIFLISKFIFNRFMNYLARSQETLFLFGIAWALMLAAVFFKLGFSLEIGALIAGISLASSKYAADLTGKMKPLRDFFIVLFFVFFGSQLTALNSIIWKNAIILSVFVIIIKPLVTMIILKNFSYTKKTNFLASISLAQISEFSLIIMLLGYSLGHLTQEILNLAVLVALITIGFSSYFINYSDWVCRKILRFLDIFDGKLSCDESCKKQSYDIILFGYHRIGYKLLESLKNTNQSFVVVDYNPKVILSLNKQRINSIYGDCGNKHFLDELPLDKAKIIISTVPDESSNLLILETLKQLNSDAVFIATAEQPRQALDLYKEGANYVLIPHHLGGEYASHIIRDFKTDKKKYKELGKKHYSELNKAKNNSTFL